MRVLAVVAVAVVAVLAMGGCAGSRPPPNAPVVDLTGPACQLPTSGEDLCGKVIRFPAGARLPVRIEAKTPFLHTEATGPATELVFDRTVYVWFWSREPLISYDRCRWMSFRKLGKGRLNFGVGRASDACHPTATVSLELDDTPPPVRTWAGG